MNKQEVVKLFKVITSVYPQFGVDQTKIDTWAWVMRDQDVEAVMKNAESYMLNHSFPPTIADVKTIPKQESHEKAYLDKIAQWEAEAGGGPEH